MSRVQFHRPARAYPAPLPDSEVVVVAPVPIQAAQQQGFTQYLQLLVPVIGSLGSLVFIIANAAGGHGVSILVILASVSVAVLSVGIGVAVHLSQQAGVKRQRARERQKYLRYLADLSAQLDGTAQQQRQYSNHMNPTIPELASEVARQDGVWERRFEDADFLDLRIGSGPAPLCRPIRLDMGSDMYADFPQDQLDEARRVVDKYSYLDDMPITAPLGRYGTVTINGRTTPTRNLARALLCQVAALHAPDDVRIIAAFPADATQEWSWLKWLPHARRLRRAPAGQNGAGETLAMLATNADELRDVLNGQVTPELERRRKLADAQRDGVALPSRPHFIILLDGYAPNSPIAQIPIIDDLLRSDGVAGVTVLCLIQDRRQEPTKVQARLTISDGGFLSFEENATNGRRLQGITPNAADPAICERIARALTPLSLRERGGSGGGELANDVQLLDLLNLHSPDNVHISQTWRPRELRDLLRVPIGIRADGEPLIVDVKESAAGGMGPHGIVVGATGSGKSELLRSLVTSLAVTHDPETLNFVLVDFKGGASFADLAELPHVSGMITNLEGEQSLVERMYATISGEMERRQVMLRNGGNLDNIRQYQAKRQAERTMEPMPYLMIIVDEFGELIANKPEFLELFIAIGRIGRSLGMHMLFATQRLEEGKIKGLEGHLRYRICLRTFTPAESTTMIGNPDAAYLPAFPGIGYFKVDNAISLFKTALITTPYRPASARADTQIVIREFTSVGRLVKAAASSTPPGANSAHTATGGDPETDMDRVIARLVEESGPQARESVHQIWLPPLPRKLPLAQALGMAHIQTMNGSRWQDTPPLGPLRTPIGLLDRPEQQRQEPMILDFSGAGGHLALVGAPQSGKSTLLRTLVASLIVTHSPRDVQIYCIDLGGGLLRIFEGAPHVGVVCGKGDRERIIRLVHQVRGLIDERELLFRKRAIDSMASYRERRLAGQFADEALGDVFLIIDDLGQFQREFDQAEGEIAELITNGLNYGIHLVVATNRWADVRPKLKDNIGSRLELRLNDPIDSDFGKAAAATVPVGVPGRGLTQAKRQFQTALPIVYGDDVTEQTPQQKAVEALVARARRSWTGESAPPLRMLPDRVTPADLPSPGAPDRPTGIPLGIEEFRLEPVYLDLLSNVGPHFIIFGDGESGKTNLVHALLRGLEWLYTPEQARFSVVDYRRTSLDYAESPNLFGYAVTADMLKDLVAKLKKELDARMPSGSNISIEALRNPTRWEGPHHFLIVDDYDLIVTPAGNPLAPLSELLLQAKDIGLHVIVARRVAGSSRSFDQVFGRLKDMGTPGIILSGEPQEGPLLGGQKAMSQPPGRGLLVRRNQRTAQVQTVLLES